MAINIYDWTLKYDPENPSQIDQVCEFLNTIAKKWGFQHEVGEQNGYEHLQGRMSLIKKSSERKLIAMCKKSVLEGAHFSITSNNAVDKSIYYYCDKVATRKQGTEPYKDTDPPKQEMTRQLADFMKLKLYPYQEEIGKLCIEYDPRSIYFICDKAGNTGKSTFAEYLSYMGLADEVPTMNSMEDIRQYVCSRRTAGIKRHCYIIDMPRGMKKDKIASFLCGIETLKNGYVSDKRYSAKDIRFTRPQIFVFTNSIPTEMDCLSTDRWKIKYLVDKHKPLIDADSEGYPLQNYTISHNEFGLDSDGD